MQTIPSLNNHFFDLCDVIYANYPNYIPEDRENIQRLFDPYCHRLLQEAEVWVGIKEHRARLVGSMHPSYGEGIAYFGYWETVEDFAVNQQLFGELENWARSLGVHTLLGPIQFTTANGYRLLQDNFARENFQGEPFNPPYYVDYCKALGFSIRETYYTEIFDFASAKFANSSIKRYTEAFLKNRGICILPLTGEFFLQNARQFNDLLLRSLKKNVALSRSNFEDCNLLWNQKMARWLCPFSSLYAVDKTGSFIGVFFMMPNYGQLLCQSARQLVALKDVNFLQHYKHLRQPQILYKTVAIDINYQHTALCYALCCRGYNALESLYFEKIAATTSISTNARLGCAKLRHPLRTYGLYQKSI